MRSPSRLIAGIIRAAGRALIAMTCFSVLTPKVGLAAPAATLLYPQNGATNADVATRPLEWSAVPGAESYSLQIGTSFGSSEFADTGAIRATQYAPTVVLPAGQTLYARVGTKIANAWAYTDSTFTAAAVQAVLTYPSNGAVADLSRQIEWTPVVAATAYVLYLGSSIGASDILNTNEVQQTWYRVFKIPIGTRIWARLYTNVGGVWRNVDSSFIAEPMTYAVAGRIYPGDAGAGATVMLSGTATRVTVADADGRYAFSGLAPGTYSVTPAAGSALRPATWSGTVASGDIIDVNFTSLPATRDRANSYDSAWKAEWVKHARDLLAHADGKTSGFVLQIGDSISHERWNAVWPRQGFGKTADDARVTTWAHGDAWGSGTADVTNRNGWYLATTDVSDRRGLTAAGGLRARTLLSGCCVDGPDMPALADRGAARAVIADPTYEVNLQIDTLIAAFGDAQVAVVMVGTNDPGDTMANLTAIVDKLEAHHIAPVLSTLPPRVDPYANLLVTRYNAAVTTLAHARSLPLIAFYEELTLRRPGNSWLNTLMSTDGVHPSSRGGDYTADSNPYEPGGSAASRTTGDALLNVGYLLRSWLTVQKLAELKQNVVDTLEGP